MNVNMKRALLCLCLVAVFRLVGCVPETYKFVTEIGKPGSGRGEFLGATDIALTPDGNVVIADAGNNRFQVVSPSDGSVKVTGGEYGTTGTKIQGITGVGVNPVTGDIYVCDYRGGKVVKYSKTGSPLARIVDKVRGPMDVAIDRQGNTFVVMSKQPAIFKYDLVGNFIETIGGKGKAALVYPTSIVIKNDDMYVSDYGSKRLLKMTLKGEVVQEFSQKGEYEPLKGPSGICVDASGNLFLLDLGEVPVVSLDRQGGLISKIGNFGKEAGQFLFPRGIVVTDPGDVLVMDNSRNVLLVFKKSK